MDSNTPRSKRLERLMLPLCLFRVVVAMGLGTGAVVFVPKNIRSGCRILVLEGCLENSAVNVSSFYIVVDSLKNEPSRTIPLESNNL